MNDRLIGQLLSDSTTLIADLTEAWNASTPGTPQWTATLERAAAAEQATTVFTPAQLRRLADDAERLTPIRAPLVGDNTVLPTHPPMVVTTHSATPSKSAATEHERVVNQVGRLVAALEVAAGQYGPVTDEQRNEWSALCLEVRDGR